MTQRQTDTSVLTALSELRSLEDERIDEERAAAAKRQSDEAAAVAQRREAELHTQRVAEAEARLRVEDESRGRDADADRRLAALRAELNAVQAERERLHGSLLAGAHEASAPRESAARPWAWAFAASAAIVACLAGLLAFRPAPPAPIYVIAPPVLAPVAQTSVAAPALPETAPQVLPTTAEDTTRPQGRPPRAGPTKRGNGHGTHTTPPPDGLDPENCDPDDPTCGM